MIDRLSSFYYNNGLSYACSHNVTLAVEWLKKSVCYNRRNTTAWNLLGLCFFRLGNFGMAEYCWIESVKNGDPVEAPRYLDNIKGVGSTGYSALKKALALSSTGRCKKALKILDEEVPDGLKKSAALLNYTGILKYVAGRKKEAVSIWQEAAAMDVSNPQSNLYLRFAGSPGKRTAGILKDILFRMFGKKGKV